MGNATSAGGPERTVGGASNAGVDSRTAAAEAADRRAQLAADKSTTADDRRRKAEVLEKISAEYRKRGEEAPIGLGTYDLSSLSKKLADLRKQSAAQ